MVIRLAQVINVSIQTRLRGQWTSSPVRIAREILSKYITVVFTEILARNKRPFRNPSDILNPEVSTL